MHEHLLLFFPRKSIANRTKMRYDKQELVFFDS